MLRAINHDVTIYPEKKDGTTVRVQIRRDVILVPTRFGDVAFKRHLHRGEWVWTDLRDGSRPDAVTVEKEVARLAFGGDRAAARAEIEKLRSY
jgi:hypothetical protein